MLIPGPLSLNPLMRFLSLLLALLLLSSCYRPMYGGKSWGGEASVSETRLQAVDIANISNEDGQILRNALIDRMYGAGRPDKTSTQLSVKLSSVIEDLGLQKDATTLRKKITYTANYTLTDKTTGKTLLNTKSLAFGSYNYIDAQYASLNSKESAQERALRELANLIVTRILVYYGEGDNAALAPAPTVAPNSAP